MEKNSIWLDDSKRDSTKYLEKDLDLDVLIIGGGITGISCAYQLINSNLNVALVDAANIGRGVTSKTTAKITYLQEVVYSNIKKLVSKDAAKLYYESQKEAINEVVNIINKNNIDCDLYKCDSYTFTEDSNKVSTLKEEEQLLKEFGEGVFNSKKLPNGDECIYSIGVGDTYVFHPLKYLEGLRKIIVDNNINIYENVKVENISKKNGYYICRTNCNIIKAKKVVLALHYPYFLFPFFMPTKATLEKSYVGSFKVDKFLDFSAISIDKPVKSIRFHSDGKNNYQIFLYGSHNICNKINEKDNFDLLKQFNYDYEYMWSNIDIMTGDYLPYIGEIDKNLFIATGYNTWGMTNGSLAGVIIRDLIMGKENVYTELFDPKRKINLGKLINFPLALGSSLISYIKGFFKDKGWYSNNIKIEKREGKTVFIYIDENKEEHIVYSKCPHMGCNVIFNEEELTWDCPCHGSRFDIDGRCIEGPSNYDISYNKEKK